MSSELKVKWCKKTAQIYQTTSDPFVDQFITCHDFKNTNNLKIEKELHKLIKNLYNNNNKIIIIIIIMIIIIMENLKKNKDQIK